MVSVFMVILLFESMRDYWLIGIRIVPSLYKAENECKSGQKSEQSFLGRLEFLVNLAAEEGAASPITLIYNWKPKP